MSALSVALSALQAHQQTMLVTSQNVANAGTDGYSTQRAVLTSTALKNSGGTLTGGVTASSIDSARDARLDARIYQATSLKSSLDVTGSALSSIEALLGTIDDANLQTQLAAVGSAFNDLAADPDDDAIAETAIATLATLTSLLRQTADGVAAASASLVSDAESAADEVNSILAQLTALNQTIARSGYAGTSSEYGDQQAKLLEELSGYLQVSAYYDSSGTVAVSCNGTMLVGASSYQAVAISTSSSGDIHLVDAKTGVRIQASSGAIQAYQDAVNDLLPEYAAQLDNIAIALIDYLGTQQTIGSNGGSLEMTSATTFSATQTTVDIDAMEYDPVHGLGYPEALTPEFPASGSCSVMCLNSYDDTSGVASTYVLMYDAGTGPSAATRSLQDMVDAINSGSGGGFTLVPPANGDITASLVASSGGYKLVIASTDGRTIDCGTAMDVRPTDDAPSDQWSSADAGFSIGGSYDGGASYDPLSPMTVVVTTPGTIGDSTDAPTISISIPVEKNGVVSMETTTLTLDATHPAGVPIALGNGLEITFDTGSLSLSTNSLEIITDASDDRVGLLGALGIDRLLSGTGASDIAIAAELTADASRLATGSSRTPGDNDIATAMASLTDAALLPGTKTSIGTAYQQLVSDLGQAIADADSMGSIQSLVLTTLENQRELAIGVDVDEQMTQLIEQQQAYSAAARVITMVRENIATLMSTLS